MSLLDDAAEITLDLAAGRWWAERGDVLRSAANRERQIERLIELISGNTRLVDITTAKVNDAIERRRGWAYRRAKGKTAKAHLPSNSTVNRDGIDTLRPILKRARLAWEVKGLPDIDWGALRLPEPKAKSLEFTDAELDAIVGAKRDHWGDFARFMARYGCRLGEMFFSLADLDVADRDNARLTLRNRKGNVIPLLPEDAATLAARAGRAAESGLDTVWFRQLKPVSCPRGYPSWRR